MWILGQASVAVAQAPRHSEVNEQNALGFESDNYILATAFDRRDTLARELGRHLGGLARTDEPRVGDLDSVEPTAREDRRELRADGLDLGELRHRASVVWPVSRGPRCA